MENTGANAMTSKNTYRRNTVALSALAVAALLAATSASAEPTYLSETATKKPRPTDEIKFANQGYRDRRFRSDQK
jgi:hypothetical protein